MKIVEVKEDIEIKKIADQHFIKHYLGHNVHTVLFSFLCSFIYRIRKFQNDTTKNAAVYIVRIQCNFMIIEIFFLNRQEAT